LTIDDLADVGRVAHEAHVGHQVDPVAWRAAFRGGCAVFLLREEVRHQEDKDQINADLVTMLDQDPALRAILAAAPRHGGRIEVG
jgi:hypothetical protein